MANTTTQESVFDLISSYQDQAKVLNKLLQSKEMTIQMLQDEVKRQNMTIDLLRTENRILTSKTNKL